MGDAPELRELLPALRDPDAAVRVSAAGALGALGCDGAPAVGPLLEACGDVDRYVRGEAVHSLLEIAGSFLEDKAAGVWQQLVAGLPALIALLDDPWWDVRCSAMSLFKEIGPLASPALPRLRTFLSGEVTGLEVQPDDWPLETQTQLLREGAAEALRAIESADH